jgi:putative SOS response-associated peptidase YedK
MWRERFSCPGRDLPFALAGTGPANGVVVALHDRMPLIVPRESYGAHDARTPELLLIEADASALRSYPVNPIVNSAQNDDPRCIERTAP